MEIFIPFKYHLDSLLGYCEGKDPYSLQIQEMAATHPCTCSRSGNLASFLPLRHVLALAVFLPALPEEGTEMVTAEGSMPPAHDLECNLQSV